MEPQEPVQVHQPMPVEKIDMEMVSRPAACPPGLEYITQIDQLLVHQQIELFEAFTGFETNNKYVIKNSMGQQVYFAAEETNVCMRICCGSQRSFVIHIVDNTQREVMRISRNFKCCAGCCWCAGADCCAFEVQVEAPVGQVIGYVRQMKGCWYSFDIKDEHHDTVLKIDAPCCLCQTICCRADVEFQVFTADKKAEVGKISKQYPGLAREMFTDADNFGVTFPMDLDVKVKSTLLAAVFLVDFMFYEEKKNNNNN
ncbi:phospholipid scramblase 2-like [Ptychodera flava]|uniref:phospholipid scramblase 2-like n=1 Tax=Ptychodera flava TaxID=63121 RepID=UPI00396A9683